MPSRINMGPDGGPYIAINENNGNIELEDNTGTTVAIWDDTNSQWDFQNNPISNVDSLSSNSVNTGQVNNIELIEGTSDIVSVNSRLQEIDNDTAGVLLGRFDVGATPIKIPSDKTVVNYGTLRQQDQIPGGNVRIVINADASASGSDKNITFINYGTIDGNSPNQTDQNATRYAVQFLGVNGLEFHGVHVINPVDFCMSVNACENVRFSNFHAEVDDIDGNQDGLHFYDTNNVQGHGVTGTSEDDLLAIAVLSSDEVANYSISGVEGRSINANLVKLHRANSVLGDGTTKTLKNISVTGAVGQDLGASGVHLGPYDANTVFKNVTIDADITSPSSHGLNMTPGIGTNGATFNECELNITVESPGLEGVLALGPGEVKNSQLNATVKKSSGSDSPLRVDGFDSSDITLNSEFDGGPPNLNVTASDSVNIDVTIDGGGRGVQLGSGSTAVTDSLVRGTVKNVDSQDVIEISGGGSDNNRIELHGSDPTVALIDGNTSTENGTGTEDLGTSPTSAPLGDWPNGTQVRNSNADNDETWLLVDGTWVQIV